MVASTSASCPRCGAPLSARNAEELCAACLMVQAIASGEELEAETVPPNARPSDTSSPDKSEFPADFGSYRLLRLLGSGGMGMVYEAEQLSTGRRVAVKMLSQNLESSDMRGRFLREGRLAAGISHPNSLYVFGTEEIEGIPVITMEIADSGTLADRLEQHGQLPITDAVDAVLGLIAGLEAANAAGVLHRDVKPSNVFLHPDGTVKVGDYGLSVSTVATVDSFVTSQGVALGTPAYAAPEQLRGDELDVRADLYSVGATLFTLLTDRSPIEGTNPVQIVAAALDEKPKSLTALRSDVPVGLAQIVARCLAKKPGQRYADYAELRNVLLPYSSDTPHPAPLSKRTLAYLIDELLSWYVPGVLVASYLGVNSVVELPPSEQFWPVLILAVWYIGYYALPEGGFGAGIGKWLSQIRVARTDGRPPGFARALIRAAIAWLSRQGMIILLLGMTFTGIFAPPSQLINATLYSGFYWGFLLAPLATMRRHNGFALLWDMLTGTRVMEKPKGVVRATVDVAMPVRAPAESTEFIGPYAIVEQIAAGWLAGVDPDLHRPVWLRECDPVEPDTSRRNVARPGRARWQQSIRTPELTWDVFEARPGVPVATLLDRKTKPHRTAHWKDVRHWLYDLAIEIAQASEDGTLPGQLELDHVWITGDGRAMLLDEPWPKQKSTTQCSDAQCFDVNDVVGQQRFIANVSNCTDPTTVPLHARRVLRNLESGSFDRLSFLAGNLRSLLRKPARLDKAVRAASLFAIPVALTAVAVFYGLFAIPASNRARESLWEREFPGLPVLNTVLRYRDGVESDAHNHEFIDVHLAGHYDYADFGDLTKYQRYRLLDDHERDTLRRALSAAPEFTSEQLQEADRRLHEGLADFLDGERRTNLARRFDDAADFLVGLLLLVSGTQLATLTALGATVGQYLFGFAVVNARGEPAGRPRLLLRWLVAWVLFFLALASGYATDSLLLLLLLPWCLGLVVAVIRPSRGVHDQLSRCWLVPR